jgi:hypothetical protein
MLPRSERKSIHAHKSIVTCWVTYTRVLDGLDDWIYGTLYIHTTRDCRQYSAIAILQLSSSPLHTH